MSRPRTDPDPVTVAGDIAPPLPDIPWEGAEQLRHLADALPACISYLDTTLHYRFVNRTYERWFGRRRKDILGQHPRDILGEAAFKVIGPRLAEALAGKRITHESRVPRVDGGVRHILSTLVPAVGEEGKVRGVYVLTNDISELKDTEAALRESERRLRERTDELSERVKELRCLYAISTVVARADLSLAEMLQQVADLIPSGWLYPAITRGRVSVGNQVYTSEDFHESGWRLTSDIAVQGEAAGSVEVFYLEERPERHSGPFLREEGYLIDEIAARVGEVVERRRVAEELQQAKQRAEMATRLKSEFLANMSHELRTPIHSVLGYSELLLDGVDGPLLQPQHASMQRVERNARHLLTLIDQLLDLSRIEANRFELEPAPFSIRTVVEETLELLEVLARKKGLHLTSQIAPEIPKRLVGDAERLREVLINLGDNGIKFTDRGQVEVSVAPERIGDADALLRFSVRDSGPGIPSARQQHIFEAFVQADGTTTRAHGGAGLGLAISSRLVRMLGGNIWVESAPGGGSTFHFTARFNR